MGSYWTDLMAANGEAKIDYIPEEVEMMSAHGPEIAAFELFLEKDGGCNISVLMICD